MKSAQTILRIQNLIILILFACELDQRGQGTTFTYQRRLMDDGSLATGSY